MLGFADQPLRDLSILQGIPIDELDVHRCPFVDLTPLRPLKLKKLSLSSDTVTDFTPLRGMPIERLYLINCSKLTDVSFLTELPLRELYLDGCKNLPNVAALAEIATLEKVTVPADVQNVEALRKLGYRLFHGVPDTTVTEFWEAYDLISKLRGAGLKPQGVQRLKNGLWDLDFTEADVSNLHVLRGMPIERLSQWKTKVTDLSVLKGMPLKYLELSHTPIADLGPLRDMPLKNLRLFHTHVSDLSPLQGLSLERVDLGYTNVTDISVLRGMPLIEAGFNSCPALTDVSPLANSKELQTVTLPPNAKNFEFLRDFPKLKRIGFGGDPKSTWLADKTAAQFWKEYDAKKNSRSAARAN